MYAYIHLRRQQKRRDNVAGAMVKQMLERFKIFMWYVKKGLKNPEILFPYLKGRAIAELKAWLRYTGNPRLPEQVEKISTLLKEDKFALIILDACRYDCFEEECENFLNGNLEKVWSAGGDTFEFIRNTFPDLYDLVYVSGAVPVNSLRSGDIFSLPLYKGYVPSKHFWRIVNVWNQGWDADLGTCPPEAVTQSALNNMAPCMIIHYFQPHAPYIGEKKILGSEDRIWKLVGAGKISLAELREAYRFNLRKVLSEVRRLVEKLDNRRVVITADHGELLGEDALLGHRFTKHRILHEVPWLEVEK